MKQIGETKKFTKGILLNPLKQEKVPEHNMISEFVIFHKNVIGEPQIQLIQREVHKILGRNYCRSFLSQ